MKIRNKICSLFIVLILIFGLNGCNGDDLAQTIDGYTEDDIYEVVIENITFGEEYPDTESIEKLINEITIPAIQCKVKIKNCFIGDHESLVKKAAKGNEKLDLINTGLTTSISELVSEGVVIPLDDLLINFGKSLMEDQNIFEKTIVVDGKIYAVSAIQYPGRSMGIGYNLDMANEYGLVFSETVSLEDLTRIGAQLKNANSELYLTSNGDKGLTAFSSFFDIEEFDDNFIYGVVFNPVYETEIENVYESEEYKEYCLTLKEWRIKGYIPSDSLNSGENPQDLFNQEKTLFQWTSVSPQTEFLIAKKNLNFEEVLIAITPNRILTSQITEYAWGISSASENPEKAMELLDYIYTNSEVANLLQNGRPGIEYELLDENTISYIEGADRKDMGYGSYFSLYGNQSEVFQFDAKSEYSQEELLEYSQEALPTKSLGYIFKTDKVTLEVEAVSRVVQEYVPILETGMSENVDETLKEFQAELKSAGIDKIILENQSQLNEWLVSQ